MGFGAVFGALNTMYSAVSARTREIATLRALGFRSAPVLISVLVESLALAWSAACSAARRLLRLRRLPGRTLNLQTFTQVSFTFAVTPELLGLGRHLRLIMGLIGGLFPAVRAARLPVTEGLRALGVLLATGLALWSAPLVTGGGRALAADESLPSIEAAAEFAAYTLDANALERLAVDTAPIARGTAAERYTHALVQWRRAQVAATLGGLDGEAGAATGKPRREAALAVARKAGKACLEAADRAVDAAAVKVEADALGAACAVWAARAEVLRAPAALLSRRRWSKEGLAQAPANPRLQLAEAWSDLLLPAALAADRARGCTAVRTLGAEVCEPDRHDRGWAALGRSGRVVRGRPVCGGAGRPAGSAPGLRAGAVAGARTRAGRPGPEGTDRPGSLSQGKARPAGLARPASSATKSSSRISPSGAPPPAASRATAV